MTNSCSNRIFTRGNIISDQDIEKIQDLDYSKDELLRFLGNPHYIDISNNIWYYFGRRISYKTFSKSILSQRIVKISFGKENKIINMTYIDDSFLKDFKYHSPIYWENNVVKDYINNLEARREAKKNFRKKHYVPEYF